MVQSFLKYRILIPLALILGPAPYFSEPHLSEKIRMLAEGVLRKPIDIFDLILHSAPLILLGYKAGSDLARRITAKNSNES